MPRRTKPPNTTDPFGSADLRLVSMIRGQDELIRASLCTLARRGVAFRQSEPRRAAKWLDLLSSHPLYKAGQFLFDLLEWEDFMLDGPPPSVLGSEEITALLRRIARTMSGIELAQASDKAAPLAPTGGPSLPELEPGFYLYRDVVLGLIAHILESSPAVLAEQEKSWT
jgi:hypothetical protein